MHLTKFSDYALRVLMLAAASGEQRVTIEDAATAFGISQAHLKKVVLTLTRAGHLRGIKGRSGGFHLARAPHEINLGQVLRLTETDFSTFECFESGAACPIFSPCRLRNVGREAVNAFLATFDKVTLADVALPKTAFASFLQADA
jgi:Rrf2 family transcriptional regulator, nitric oxide-sensitive transcriptional repressor